MKKNKIEFMGILIVFIVGIVFLTVGIFILCGAFSIDEEDRVYTTATITDIETSYEADGDSSHEVYVEYQVNGKIYKSELNSYVSSYREGKEIEVYYDKNNPSKVQAEDSSKILEIIFILLGGICTVIGGGMLFAKFKKIAVNKNLKLNGERIDAEYVETIVNTSYTVNNRHPYRIICKWKNPNTGLEETFKSENVWENPEYIIESRGIKKIAVYIEPQNPKKYFMDVDTLFE